MSNHRRLTIIVTPIALVMIHLWIKAHITRLRPLPISTDPCDAVNAAGFAVIFISAIWALVVYVRNTRSKQQEAVPWRTAESVILAVFMTVAAETIALLRNRSFLHPEQKGIFYLLALETLAIIVAQASIISARSAIHHRPRYLAVALSVAGPLFLLAVTPEWPIYGNTLVRHLLTVLTGFCALLLPVHSIPLLLTGEKPGLPTNAEKLTFALGLFLVLAGFWQLGHASATSRIAFLIILAGCLALTIAELARPLGIVRSTETPLA